MEKMDNTKKKKQKTRTKLDIPDNINISDDINIPDKINIPDNIERNQKKGQNGTKWMKLDDMDRIDNNGQN